MPPPHTHTFGIPLTCQLEYDGEAAGARCVLCEQVDSGPERVAGIRLRQAATQATRSTGRDVTWGASQA